MHRSASLILILVLTSVPAFTQTATECQSLQAIAAELRQLRHDLQTSNAMATRAQIALYRLQRESEALARVMQRVSDARSNVAKAETSRNQKALEIEQGRAASNQSDNPQSQRAFEEVVLPRLKAELELLQKEERRARAEEAEAEQQLREEQTKLDGLNDLLDRYNNALEEVGRK
jgi:hypothetical protein